MPANSAPAKASAREFDIVVFGATGFVGRLVAEYLAQAAPEGTRIALAGRSADRLEAVRSELSDSATDWPLIVADSSDKDAMDELAGRTRMVATTVGPYAKYGMTLVGACARAGTNYADLTGEVLFVRDSINRFQSLAHETGAKIVHACGFDSIPSDLGVLAAFNAAQGDDAGDLLNTTLLVKSLRGGFSGGTIDSLRNQVDQVKADRSLRHIVNDPYSLSPDRRAEPKPGDKPDGLSFRRDSRLGEWVGPFVMGPYNTRIVRRSNALTDWSYGRDFRYEEVMGFGNSLTSPVFAAGTSAGLGSAVIGMGFKPSRMVLDRVLPAPGEGPSEEDRANGRFRIEVHAQTTSGKRYVATVAAQGDPGYAATSVMLGQSALCLALDDLPAPGGVLTPATAMGTALIDRLREADFEISVATA